MVDNRGKGIILFSMHFWSLSQVDPAFFLEPIEMGLNTNQIQLQISNDNNSIKEWIRKGRCVV
jgi:hypothetical protein